MPKLPKIAENRSAKTFETQRIRGSGGIGKIGCVENGLYRGSTRIRNKTFETQRNREAEELLEILEGLKPCSTLPFRRQGESS
jgi:hypothetical protein